MAVSKATVGTFVAALSALILMLAAFSVPQWQNRTDTAQDQPQTGDVTTSVILIGLSSWKYTSEADDANGNMISKLVLEGTLASDGDITETITTTNPAQTTTVTLQPPQSTNIYQQQGVASLISTSITARNNVEGTGIPAFLLGVTFFVLLGLAQAGKGYPWFRPVSIIVCVLTAVMTFLGVFLYAKVLNVGYSFIIWAGFAIFALLGGIFTIIPSSGKKGRYLPLICMTVALIFGIAGLATTAWYSQIDDSGSPRVVTTANAGVKAYSVLRETYDAAGTTVVSSVHITSTFDSDEFHRVSTTTNPASSTDQTITKCPTTPLGSNFCYQATAEENNRFKDFIPGGQKVLGCGIPALFFLVAGMAAMFTLLRGSPPQHAKLIAIGCAVVASALGFLGLFLYAAISSVGASFIIYAAAGFMWVLASCLAFNLLNNSGTGGPTGSTSSYPAQKSEPAKAAETSTTAEV